MLVQYVKKVYGVVETMISLKIPPPSAVKNTAISTPNKSRLFFAAVEKTT